MYVLSLSFPICKGNEKSDMCKLKNENERFLRLKMEKNVLIVSLYFLFEFKNVFLETKCK